MPILDAERRTSLRVGGSIIVAFSLGLVLIWTLGYLPGIVGRTFTLVSGFLWTPFIMEPVIFTAGFFSLLILNHYRRKSDGPEIVTLETQPDSGANYPTRPEPHLLSCEELTSAIENAAEQGNHKEVTRLMLELSEEELGSESVIATRLKIAMANRDPNHIRGLSKRLRDLNPEHPLLAKRR